MLRSILLEASSQFNKIVRNNKFQKVVLFKKVYTDYVACFQRVLVSNGRNQRGSAGYGDEHSF